MSIRKSSIVAFSFNASVTVFTTWKVLRCSNCRFILALLSGFSVALLIVIVFTTKTPLVPSIGAETLPAFCPKATPPTTSSRPTPI